MTGSLWVEQGTTWGVKRQVQWHGSIVFLGAESLASIRRFYSEMLGLSVYKDQGKCLIYEVQGGGLLGFCTHLPVARSGRSPIITLLTEDVDEVYQHLLEAGIPLQHPPVRNDEFCIYHFFVQDPNGYAVEIQRFL